jgi:dihydroflavonol-4-reductase
MTTFCAIDFGSPNPAIALPAGAGMRLVELEPGQPTLPTAVFCADLDTRRRARDGASGLGCPELQLPVGERLAGPLEPSCASILHAPRCHSIHRAQRSRSKYMADTVFVSGGSGYIAGFLIRQLLEQGWTVHTSLRSLAREPALRELLGGDESRLKVFAADLTRNAGWVEAMQGCSHVAHVASPLPGNWVKKPDDLVVPARDGVLRALRAAREAGVRRFVMTSSVAAIIYGRGRGVHHFTEADWTPAEYPGISPYTLSKTLAERAARDWVAREGTGLEFCSVNPSLVLGPVWGADYSSSVTLVKRLLMGSMPGCPDLGFGIVDVRDVADLHLRMLTAPGMAGERVIASGPFLKVIDIARMLREHLGEQARRVPTRRLPDLLVRVAALFDPMVRTAVTELGAERHTDARHARELLGWQARPVQQTVLDTARSLLEQGLVRP